jgi:hypothetical protein
LVSGSIPRMPATKTKSPARLATDQVPVGSMDPLGERYLTPRSLGCGSVKARPNVLVTLHRQIPVHVWRDLIRRYIKDQEALQKKRPGRSHGRAFPDFIGCKFKERAVLYCVACPAGKLRYLFPSELIAGAICLAQLVLVSANRPCQFSGVFTKNAPRAAATKP